MTSPTELVDLAESAGVDNIPPSVMMTIVRRVIAASAATSELHGKALADDLNRLFRRLWARLPQEARVAIQGTTGDALGFKKAFAAGQVSFANAVAGQMSELRESEDFRVAVLGRKYAKYMSALAQGDKTGVELVAAVGVEDATVSRRLSELRELGITDFRRDGRTIVNFLTPAARSVYKSARHADASQDASQGSSAPAEKIRSSSNVNADSDPSLPSMTSAGAIPRPDAKTRLLNELTKSVQPHLRQVQHVDALLADCA
jgi:DNA-binding transcriptional ArsR family regulator